MASSFQSLSSKYFVNVTSMFKRRLSYPAEFTVDPRRMKCIEESPEGPFHRHHDAKTRPVFPYTLKQECSLLWRSTNKTIDLHLVRRSSTYLRSLCLRNFLIWVQTLEKVELYTKEICLVDSILRRCEHPPLPIDLYKEDLRNNFIVDEVVLNMIRC